ncbi:MAG: PrsW family glutamic-type intramembrane protease [Actinomycetota bacterium]
MTEPVVVPAQTAPGWYPDPWSVAPWRWWDGNYWTAHVNYGDDHKPRLPSWLSVPVLIGLILTTPLVIFLAFTQITPVLLGLVPLVFVLPAMAWLDRVEPEPRTSRIHAVLWGGTIAGVVSGFVNTIVGVRFGDAVAAAVSAPLIEEAMKGLGIYWAVRRREIDGVMDGIVYAGWVAVGFAVIEDMLYFANAAAADMLVGVFVLRAIFTPFAHPLFTLWIGLAIGLAVARNQSLFLNALWGYGVAVVSHAAWNGSLVYAEQSGNEIAIPLAALCFFLLFVAAVTTVIVLRRREQKRFQQAVPMLAARHGMSTEEVQTFGHWSTMLSARRRLPRPTRSRFDAVHAALARLALLHSRPGPVDQVAEQRLAHQLQEARTRYLTT